MSDGWEYAWNQRRPGTMAAFNLHADDANQDFDGDHRSNLDEYLLGLNPYRADDPPAPLQRDKASTQSGLINIDLGSSGSMAALGVAAAGYDSSDQWNEVGPPQNDNAI